MYIKYALTAASNPLVSILPKKCLKLKKIIAILHTVYFENVLVANPPTSKVQTSSI